MAEQKRDYYEVLGVSKTAKDEELKRLQEETDAARAEMLRVQEEEKQKLADGILAAKETADRLIAEAEEKAAAIIADAEKEKEKILADAKSAKTEVSDFRRQIRDVLRTMDEGLKHCEE